MRDLHAAWRRCALHSLRRLGNGGEGEGWGGTADGGTGGGLPPCSLPPPPSRDGSAPLPSDPRNGEAPTRLVGHPYVVTVLTGTHPEAGTDCGLYVELTAANGVRSGALPLRASRADRVRRAEAPGAGADSPTGPPFRRPGGSDAFRVVVPSPPGDLGDLAGVRAWHDSAGHKASFQLRGVDVACGVTGRVWRFRPIRGTGGSGGRWLAAAEALPPGCQGDGRTFVDLGIEVGPQRGGGKTDGDASRAAPGGAAKRPYEIRVRCADRQGASCRGDCYVTLRPLQGDRGRRHRLQAPGQAAAGAAAGLARGATVAVVVEEAGPLGDLEGMELECPSDGRAWTVDRAWVTDLVGGRRWRMDFDAGMGGGGGADDTPTAATARAGGPILHARATLQSPGDAMEPATRAYEVTVDTCDAQGAGTSADVSLALVGAGGETTPAVALGGRDGDFSRGVSARFLLRGIRDVGPAAGLTHVVIGQDGRGAAPDWRLLRVAVADAGGATGGAPAPAADRNTGSAAASSAPVAPVAVFYLDDWLRAEDGTLTRRLPRREAPPAPDVSFYTIDVVTSDARGAGTDGEVSVTLHSGGRSAGPIVLDDPGRDDAQTALFGRGQTDRFRRQATTLGPLDTLVLRLEPCAEGRPWRPREIRVLHEALGRSFLFSVGEKNGGGDGGAWLSLAEGLERTLRGRCADEAAADAAAEAARRATEKKAGDAFVSAAGDAKIRRTMAEARAVAEEEAASHAAADAAARAAADAAARAAADAAARAAADAAARAAADAAARAAADAAARAAANAAAAIVEAEVEFRVRTQRGPGECGLLDGGVQVRVVGVDGGSTPWMELGRAGWDGRLTPGSRETFRRLITDVGRITELWVRARGQAGTWRLEGVEWSHGGAVPRADECSGAGARATPAHSAWLPWRGPVPSGDEGVCLRACPADEAPPWEDPSTGECAQIQAWTAADALAGPAFRGRPPAVRFAGPLGVSAPASLVQATGAPGPPFRPGAVDAFEPVPWTDVGNPDFAEVSTPDVAWRCVRLRLTTPSGRAYDFVPIEGSAVGDRATPGAPLRMEREEMAMAARAASDRAAADRATAEAAAQAAADRADADRAARARAAEVASRPHPVRFSVVTGPARGQTVAEAVDYQLFAPALGSMGGGWRRLGRPTLVDSRADLSAVDAAPDQLASAGRGPLFQPAQVDTFDETWSGELGQLTALHVLMRSDSRLSWHLRWVDVTHLIEGEWCVQRFACERVLGSRLDPTSRVWTTEVALQTADTAAADGAAGPDAACAPTTTAVDTATAPHRGYRVTFSTKGNCFGGGAPGQVFFELVGVKGTSGIILPDDAGKVRFRAGRVDELDFPSIVALGSLRQVRVGHAGAGAWKVSDCWVQERRDDGTMGSRWRCRVPGASLSSKAPGGAAGVLLPEPLENFEFVPGPLDSGAGGCFGSGGGGGGKPGKAEAAEEKRLAAAKASDDKAATKAAAAVAKAERGRRDADARWAAKAERALTKEEDKKIAAEAKRERAEARRAAALGGWEGGGPTTPLLTR